MTTLARTLGELKRTAYRSQTVRAEIRANLRRKLAAKQELFPGIVGYERTVIPFWRGRSLRGRRRRGHEARPARGLLERC